MSKDSISKKRNGRSAKAALCRAQAHNDRPRRQHWLRVAKQWDRLAKADGKPEAATHEIQEGRMIPKPAES